MIIDHVIRAILNQIVSVSDRFEYFAIIINKLRLVSKRWTQSIVPSLDYLIHITESHQLSRIERLLSFFPFDFHLRVEINSYTIKLLEKAIFRERVSEIRISKYLPIPLDRFRTLSNLKSVYYESEYDSNIKKQIGNGAVPVDCEILLAVEPNHFEISDIIHTLECKNIVELSIASEILLDPSKVELPMNYSIKRLGVTFKKANILSTIHYINSLQSLQDLSVISKIKEYQNNLQSGKPSTMSLFIQSLLKSTNSTTEKKQPSLKSIQLSHHKSDLEGSDIDFISIDLIYQLLSAHKDLTGLKINMMIISESNLKRFGQLPSITLRELITPSLFLYSLNSNLSNLRNGSPLQALKSLFITDISYHHFHLVEYILKLNPPNLESFGYKYNSYPESTNLSKSTIKEYQELIIDSLKTNKYLKEITLELDQSTLSKLIELQLPNIQSLRVICNNLNFEETVEHLSSNKTLKSFQILNKIKEYGVYQFTKYLSMLILRNSTLVSLYLLLDSDDFYDTTLQKQFESSLVRNTSIRSLQTNQPQLDKILYKYSISTKSN